MPGFVTASLVCMTLQYLANEGSVARIKYVAKLSPTIASTPIERDLALSEIAVTEKPPREFPQKVMDFLTWVAPFKQLTDEEYLELMKKKRDAASLRLASVRKHLDDPEKQFGPTSGVEKPP